MDSTSSTQKPLSVLLDEIEGQRRHHIMHVNHVCHGCGLVCDTLPALVKALRKAIYELEKVIGHPLKDLVIGAKIAALLNQGRTTQDKDLGIPGAT